MLDAMYFILEGNHGATYIFNAKDTGAVTFSLKFYKARIIRQKVMKKILKFYLNSLALLYKIPINFGLKNTNRIKQYLEISTNMSIDFGLDENCSILISPTRDKIIVHHHGHYFQKFAFGKSYKNVKNEAKIYELLDKPLQHFKVSKFQDYVNRENNFCSFKLGSPLNSSNLDVDITLALVELFNISRKEGYLFLTYLEKLKQKYIINSVTHESIDKVFDKLEASYKNVRVDLGLVHRDFKPWNINDEQGLLIYDFEESIIDGLPLEDLFNYYIDPIIRYFSPSEVAKYIFKEKYIKEYERYLHQLEISIDFKVFLYCYSIERIVFWANVNEIETSEKYCTFLELILMESM